MPCPIEITLKSKEVLNQIKFLIAENDKLPFDYEITSELKTALEEAADSLEFALDFDPSPDYLYDNTGGESAISAGERHGDAWKQKNMP